MPPLYMVPKGKKKVYYLDNTVMAKENRKIFNKTYTIEGMDNRSVEDMIIKNADYVYEMESAAANHGISPKLLETVLINYLQKGDTKTLEKSIKKQYRFVTMSTINKVPKIEISDDQLYTIYYTESLFNDCWKILKIMRTNDKLVRKVNGSDMTMYQIMKIFDGIMPAGVQRYKGLGEQDPDELAESTTNVDTRALVRYTVKDVKEEIERIRRMESDRKLILDYVIDVKRDDLIGI